MNEPEFFVAVGIAGCVFAGAVAAIVHSNFTSKIARARRTVQRSRRVVTTADPYRERSEIEVDQIVVKHSKRVVFGSACATFLGAQNLWGIPATLAALVFGSVGLTRGFFPLIVIGILSCFGVSITWRLGALGEKIALATPGVANEADKLFRQTLLQNALLLANIVLGIAVFYREGMIMMGQLPFMVTYVAGAWFAKRSAEIAELEQVRLEDPEVIRALPVQAKPSARPQETKPVLVARMPAHFVASVFREEEPVPSVR